jgi:hypothetical protein
MAKEFNYKDYLKNNPLLTEDQGYDDKLGDSLGMKHGRKKQDMKQRRADSENMEKAKGKRKYSGDKSMDESSSKTTLSELKARIRERILSEMDAPSWGRKNSPAGDSLELDPKKVGTSTVQEKEELDEDFGKYCRENPYDVRCPGMQEAIEEYLNEDFGKYCRENPYDPRCPGMQEAEDVDIEDDENIDIDIEKDIDIDDEETESDIEVKTSVPGESTDVEAVQGLLTKAQQEAEKLGDDKLMAQIGNTITYFTRKHIVKV